MDPPVLQAFLLRSLIPSKSLEITEEMKLQKYLTCLKKLVGIILG